MSEARELRRPAPAPDPDAEQEIDLGHYAAAIAARWWLLLVGLLVGAAIGYLVSVGGGDVYRAQALIHLGVPLTPGGAAQIGSLATNPATVDQVARQDAVVRQVARESGMTPREVRAGLTVQPVSTGARTPTSVPLAHVTIRGDARAPVAKAANAMSRILVARAAQYVDIKIGALKQQLQQDNEELAVIDRRAAAANDALNDPSVSPTERLVLLSQLAIAEQRRTTVRD